jgi:tRNA (guanosine-2'-O-)-methyltransferase
MVGFTESLNISVSAAIIIQNLNRLRNSNIDWHLSETEILEKRLAWAKKNSINEAEHENVQRHRQLSCHGRRCIP